MILNLRKFLFLELLRIFFLTKYLQAKKYSYSKEKNVSEY